MDTKNNTKNLKVNIIARSFVGKRKTQNEDNLVINNKFDEQINDYYNGKHENKIQSLCVLDGMGGEKYGKLSSYYGAEFISLRNALVKEQLDRSVLKHCVTSCSKYIQHNLSQLEESRFSGTTIAGFFKVDEHNYYVYNVGDSRVYFIGKKVRQITYDDSYGQYLVKMGKLTPKELLSVPIPKNALLNALGNSFYDEKKTHVFEVDSRTNKDEYIFICSDGVSDHFTNKQLKKLFKLNDLLRIADTIDQTVESEGSNDNFTYIIYKLDNIENEG